MFLTCSTLDLFEKEATLKYAEKDVLPAMHDRMKRLACLMKAISLEGMSSSPVTLDLESQEFCLRVTSRVIAASNHKIILENGMRLPIRAIHKVSFSS